MNAAKRCSGSVAVAALLGAPAAFADLHALVVEGLGGEPVYAEQFHATAQALRQASQSVGGAQVTVLAGADATKEKILAQLRTMAKTLTADDRVAVYLIGHGSYDGYAYKFNISGPDLTADELARALDALPTQNQLIAVTGSASGALLEALKKKGRIVLTATRSGNERNITQFGSALADALSTAATDVDKNSSVSAQEVFDAAERAVKDYYEREKRLATEHPRLEGELAARFTVAQLGASAETANAAGQPQRARLNNEIEALRLRKDSLSEADYAAQLEQLLLQLAEFEDRLEQGEAAP